MNVETERKKLEKLYKQRIPAALLLNVFISATIGAYIATVFIHALPITNHDRGSEPTTSRPRLDLHLQIVR